jgi:hypothetical protein
MTDKLQSILQAEGLDHLIPKLVEQGVVDSMLPDLSESDLKSLGVDKLGERKRLLAALEAMRDTTGGSQQAVGKKSVDAIESSGTKPVANKPSEMNKTSYSQPAGEQSFKKSDASFVQASSEPSATDTTMPANKILSLILICFLGPISFFFKSGRDFILGSFGFKK